MIKIFRKIRQSLIAEGRFSKYLLYAIGEVFLVVIGILIALNVNNYNENRKLQNYEISIMKDLILGFEDDIKTLNYNIKQHKRAIISGEILEFVIDNKLPYEDSLSLHFARIHYFTYFKSSKGAYESLKSKGVETITNNSLRSDIINLIEEDYRILESNDNELTKDVLHIKRNFNQNHFNKFNIFDPSKNAFIYGGEMIPHDYSKLITNQQYQYYLGSLVESHQMISGLTNFTKSKVENMIKRIQKEITFKSN